MARINHVKSARKNQGTCQKCGKPINAGDPYKWVAIRPTPRSSRKYKRCVDCPTWRQSELSSSKLAAIYAVQEQFEDGNFQSLEDIQEYMSTAGETIREVAEEYRESAQNIEDGFGHETYVSQELAEKADTLEGWADEVEGWYGDDFADQDELDELEAQDLPEDEEEAEEAEARREELTEARESWLEDQIDEARSLLGEIPV